MKVNKLLRPKETLLEPSGWEFWLISGRGRFCGRSKLKILVEGSFISRRLYLKRANER